MRDCKCCDGVSLDKGPQEFLGGLIKTQEASYIDLRNYLFSRQCNLLLKLNRPSPWEVAQRTLDFLHNLIHELSMDTLKVCMRCRLSPTVAHIGYFIKTKYRKRAVDKEKREKAGSLRPLSFLSPSHGPLCTFFFSLPSLPGTQRDLLGGESDKLSCFVFEMLLCLWCRV